MVPPSPRPAADEDSAVSESVEPATLSSGVDTLAIDAPTTMALVVAAIAPSVEVTSTIPPAASDLLTKLAPFLMSGHGRIQVLPSFSPGTTDAMITSTGASSPGVMTTPQSPDPIDLIEMEIKIIMDGLAKLLNLSIANALRLRRGLSPRTLKLLRDQLDVLTSTAGSARAEPFKTAIDRAELCLGQLQTLHAADLEGIAHVEFRHLSAAHRQSLESTRQEMAQVAVRVQDLNERLASDDEYHIELQMAIQEKDTIITAANAAIIAAQARLEEAQSEKERLESDLAESVKKWDSQAAELQAEREKLAEIRAKMTPLNPEVLKERARKGAQEAKEASIAKCIAQLNAFYPLSL